MSRVGRAKLAKTLPKASPPNVIDAILGALVLTALLAGLRLDKLVGMNISDVHVVEDGGVLHVRGKGDNDRRIPLEAPLIARKTKPGSPTAPSSAARSHNCADWAHVSQQGGERLRLRQRAV